MKQKNYKQKRKDLKIEKREGMKQDFEDIKSRKRFVDEIKRSYRALKRSERQQIRKHIEKELE
jgi:hypothetical protein